MEVVPLNPEDPAKTVLVSKMLDQIVKDQIVSTIRKFPDIFAWKPSDMPGIDPKLVCHRLNVKPSFKPVKQKLRPTGFEKGAAVRDELDRLLEAKFIREVDYPAWLANVVLVKKASGKWRMCVDFTNLNKTCPKDSWHLPCIDSLVDATAGHDLLSFVDAYSGYHRVRMHGPDEEKTPFIMEHGTFYYKVMPFGLKNAGATFQRLVNKAFQDLIGRSIEAYVD
ncbi:reverse transcriptase family protein, partial [Serratia marcescens]|nr:reverse transcriptase family protein [Serratia marcescens]